MASIVHNEGETLLLDVLLTNATPPSEFYIGLCTGTGLAEGTTLATLAGEPVGNGYSRQLVARAAGATGWTIGPDASTDAKATAKEVTFTCTTTAWAQVTHAFVCTSASGTTGKLIASKDLATPRTLQVGDSLKVTFSLTQQ